MAFNPGGGGSGGSLSSKTDVTLSSPANGESLVYNQSTDKWGDAAVPTAQLSGLAPVASTGSYANLAGTPTVPTTASQLGALPLGGGTGKLWLGGTTQPAGMVAGDYWICSASSGGPTVPTIPVSVTATPGTGNATLSWQAPVSNGGSAITGYSVGRDGTDSTGAGPWSTVDPAGTTSRVFNNLVSGQTYHLYVAAINSVGTGPAVTMTVVAN